MYVQGAIKGSALGNSLNKEERDMTNLLTLVDEINRQAIGFDQVIHRLHHLHNLSNTSAPNYPPYNMIRNSETNYTIQVAVAGFTEKDLDITLQDGVLTISGEHNAPEGVQWLHRGIATRKFTRSFTLADSVVIGDVTLENGLLCIDLEVVIPEDQKPRKILIGKRD
jgi:molecular chaperone IbpA